MEEKKPRRKIDPKRAAKAFYCEGKTLKESFIEGGLTETQARKGKALLTERVNLMKAFKAEHKKQIAKLQLLGQAMNNEELESFTLGTLVDVAANDKSKGSERVAAASWLGKSKKLNLFAPDQAIGIYNLQIPAEWQDRYLSTETIEAVEVLPPAVAQEAPPLPATFVHPALESGKVVVPDALATKEEDSIPVADKPPSPAREFSEDDFETLR